MRYIGCWHRLSWWIILETWPKYLQRGATTTESTSHFLSYSYRVRNGMGREGRKGREERERKNTENRTPWRVIDHHLLPPCPSNQPTQPTNQPHYLPLSSISPIAFSLTTLPSPQLPSPIAFSLPLHTRYTTFHSPFQLAASREWRMAGLGFTVGAALGVPG